MINECQVYITGALWNQGAYPDDPMGPLLAVDEQMRKVSGMDYDGIYINRSENRFSNGTTREQLLFFMKGVIYNGNRFLTDSSSAALRSDIITKLASVDGLTYDDVELRITNDTVRSE